MTTPELTKALEQRLADLDAERAAILTLLKGRVATPQLTDTLGRVRKRPVWTAAMKAKAARRAKAMHRSGKLGK